MPVQFRSFTLMKKVLFILAKEDFRDEEFFIPAEILKNAGHQISVASDGEAGEIAVGSNGGDVKINYDYKNINPADFDLIIFVGGPGAIKHLNNEAGCQIARKTLEAGKKLAAICIAPTILARAGVLAGKKATAWTSPLNRKSIDILKENGAIYVDKPVVEDEIITANGPDSAEEFGNALKRILEQTP